MSLVIFEPGLIGPDFTLKIGLLSVTASVVSIVAAELNHLIKLFQSMMHTYVSFVVDG